MKKLYFLLLLSLLGSARLWAQSTDSLRLKLDYVVANLDKSQVPSGRLDAYATPLVPLAAFNGQLADSTRTTPAVFRALYATAYTASIYGPNAMPTLPSYNSTVAAAEAAAGSATIPIMAQLINYGTVRPNAFSQNLLTLRKQQVYDVAGRSASPYTLRSAFAVAPAREFAATGNVSLVFPTNLYVQLGGFTTLPLLAVDFGDGRGYVGATWGQPLRATYTTSGTKRIKVRFTHQQGTPPLQLSRDYFSQFDLFVVAPAAAAATARTTAGTTADASVYFGAKPGQAAGTAYIHYGTDHTTGITHTTLTKPFIVAEGFDRSYIAPHTAANYSIGDFLTEIRTSKDPSAFDFRNALENVGDYDIVFIDYANGTDDIMLNAGLFKVVLDYVNTNKNPAAHQQNVVMGMSMGGLIARYKLAELEKASPGSTQTRLLILQDSPQRGANIPLGLSALLRQAQLNLGSYTTGNVDVTLQEANALLDQPATKQLLLYQTALTPRTLPGGIPYNTIDFAGNSFIDGPYRTMVNYPAPYKIVAVSQGSQCGVGLYAPYTELIRGGGHLNLFNLPFVFAGSVGLNGEVIVNAIPANGQANRVSGLHAFWNVQIFFGLITIKVDFTRANFSCPAGLLPLDGAAGGTEPIGDAINSKGGFITGNATKGPFWFPYNGAYSLAAKFCFIPTASGLDIADFNTASLTGSYINGVTSTSFSRTNSFLAQESRPQTNAPTLYNQPHLTFTARNGEWMYNEMQRPFNGSNYVNTVGCSSECTAPPIISSSLYPGQRLCVGSSATFSIPNLPASTVVNWSATPASNFTVATGTGPTFTATASSGAIGNSTITALVGPCQTSASLALPTGPGEPKGYYNSGGGSGTLSTVQTISTGFGAVSPEGLDIGMFITDPYNFTFSADLPGLYLSQTQGTNTHFILKPGQGVAITVTATNAPCGLVGRFVFIYPRSPYRLSAAPNPAGTELTVTRTADSAPAAAPASLSTSAPQAKTGEAFTADLYDTYGKKVKTKKSEHDKAVLDVRDLPAGLYNLRVGEGKDALSDHIQVTH